ncbi:MAG: acyl-CoA dehydrogenase family protein [Myxococcaceae bacterium]
MLAFDPGDELSALQKTVREFAAKKVRPSLRETEKKGLARPLEDQYAELGLLGLDWPAEAGGMAMGMTARVLVEEELAYGDLGTSFALDRGGAAASLLVAAGTEQAHAALKELVSGRGRAALAASEEGKAQRDFRTTARQDGASWVVSGKKSYVLGGGDAAFHVVLAQVEPGKGLDGAGAFLLKGFDGLLAKGVTALGLSALPLREVTFERMRGVRLDAPGGLPALLRKFYDSLSLVTAARAVGCAAASFEYARAYAEERVAFGKPIGHFQAIAFLLSDMATAADAARWLTWKAAWAHDRGPSTAEACAAQGQALEAAFFCANSAVQVLGGAGYVQDHPVEKWMREAKMLALYGLNAQSADATLAAVELGQSPLAEELFPLPSLHAAIT